jgi:hypothetical protein
MYNTLCVGVFMLTPVLYVFQRLPTLDSEFVQFPSFFLSFPSFFFFLTPYLLVKENVEFKDKQI